MRRAITVEASKLRTLPTVWAAGLAIVVISGVLAIAFAGLVLESGVPASAVAVAVQVVPYLQAGIIVLGILPVGQEYAGRQIATTLSTTPHRTRVIVGKSIAALAVTSLASIAAVLTAWGAAEVMLRADETALDATGAEHVQLVGAVGYLALIGLLAHGGALLLRGLLPTLITLLLVVYALPPLLSGLGEHTRWLPSVAGADLYAPTTPLLSASTGGLILAAWVTVVIVSGTLRFIRSDA